MRSISAGVCSSGTNGPNNAFRGPAMMASAAARWASLIASRVRAASSSAASPISARTASVRAPSETRYFSRRSIGSRRFQGSTSRFWRYRVGSSEFVCDSIR